MVDGLLRNALDAAARARLLPVAATVTAAGGSVAFAADGSFTFTPTPNFAGQASFTATLNLADSVYVSGATLLDDQVELIIRIRVGECRISCAPNLAWPPAAERRAPLATPSAAPLAWALALI